MSAQIASPGKHMIVQIDYMAKVARNSEEKVANLESKMLKYTNDIDIFMNYWKDTYQYAKHNKFFEKTVQVMNKMNQIDFVRFNRNIEKTSESIYDKIVQMDKLEQWVLDKQNGVGTILRDTDWNKVVSRYTTLMNQIETRVEEFDWESGFSKISRFSDVINSEQENVIDLIREARETVTHFNSISSQIETHEIIKLIANSTVHLTGIIEYLDHMVTKIKDLK